MSYSWEREQTDETDSLNTGEFFFFVIVPTLLRVHSDFFLSSSLDLTVMFLNAAKFPPLCLLAMIQSGNGWRHTVWNGNYGVVPCKCIVPNRALTKHNNSCVQRENTLGSFSLVSCFCPVHKHSYFIKKKKKNVREP